MSENGLIPLIYYYANSCNYNFVCSDIYYIKIYFA